MIKIAQIHLQPTAEHLHVLRRALKEANKACNEISTIAFEQQIFTRFNLHHSCYHDIRSRTGLSVSVQIVIRAIAKVADSYRKEKEIKHVFKPSGTFGYDVRILTDHPWEQTVSIWRWQGDLPVVFVNPRYTSQCCSNCCHIEKANRKSQSEFQCPGMRLYRPCRL